MEEKYKLTKEEKEIIKSIGKLGIKAKRITKEYITPATLLAHLYDKEFEKLEQAGEIKDVLEKHYRTSTKMCKSQIRKSLEDDLELCKKIQNEDILSMITKDSTDKSKYVNLEKKLTDYIEKIKPAIQEYITLLEGKTTPRGKIKGAIELAKWNEEYASKMELFLQGKIDFNDLPMLGGETRSEELKAQDKENTEKMKKYHKAEDKTGLELPLAEGLKEEPKKVEEKKEEPKKKKEIPPSNIQSKKISAKDLTSLTDTYLMQDGIAEPGHVKKGYATKCTNKDMQNFIQSMDYDTIKRLDIVNCSERDNLKFFEHMKPRYVLRIDMYYGDAVMQDTKTGKSKIVNLKFKNYGKS